MFVHVDFRRWPDTEHWQFRMRRLGEDEHGIWLWSLLPGWPSDGAPSRRRCRSTPLVELITHDAWWSAIWNGGEARHAMYVDIATPARWNGDRVTLIDLDLDIVRYRNGDVALVDEDEFDEHRIALDYPKRVVDGARTAAAKVYLDVVAAREPFGDVAASWMESAFGRVR